MYQIVLTTCNTREQASTIAKHLVEAELAACVNIVPAVESVYRWQGQIEVAQELLLIIKSSESHFQALSDMIKSLHSYDVPEIVAVKISNGSTDYLSWLKEELK